MFVRGCVGFRIFWVFECGYVRHCTVFGRFMVVGLLFDGCRVSVRATGVAWEYRDLVSQGHSYRARGRVLVGVLCI